MVQALDPELQLNQYGQTHWGVDEQLPQVSVTAIVQDPVGYIWVGTQNGVTRFNGTQFVTFTKSNTPALSSNIITDLLIDSHDRLWVLSESGLMRATSYGFQSIAPSKFSGIKPNKLIEHNNQIYVSSSIGLFSIAEDKLSASPLSSESHALLSVNQSLYVGGRGRLSIVQDNGIEELNFPVGFNTAAVNDLKLVDDEVWVATTLGLLIYSNNKFEHAIFGGNLLKDNIRSLYHDKEGITWIAADTRMIRIKERSLLFDNESEDLHRVTTFLNGRENAFWLGTLDRGLYKLTDSWSARFHKPHGLGENLVWSVAANNDDDLFVGTQQGIFRYEEGRFENFVAAQRLSNPAAYTLYFDDNGFLWIGTKGGLAVVDGAGVDIEEIDPSPLSGLQVNAIYKDSSNNYWVATEKGIFIRKNETFVQLATNTPFENRSYRGVVEYEGIIYLATHQGLIKVEGEERLFTSVQQLSGSFVTSFKHYKSYLVIGTYGDGIYVLDNDVMTNITHKMGLIFDDSFSLSVLNNQLWVSGFDGVYSLNLDSLEEFVKGRRKNVLTTPVLKDSGYLQGSQKAYCCNGAGHAKSVVLGDSIWYPTRQGVLKLNPTKINRDFPIVSSVIERIGVSGQNYDLYFDDATKLDSQQFSFESRDINFKFVGLTSFDEGLINYRYRLNGYSSEWNENGSSTSAFFTNLPHGNYIFEVIASNRDGKWNPLPTQFEFEILPRVYETIAFKLLTAVLVCLFLYGFYQLILRRNKSKVAALEALILKKTDALLKSNRELASANERLTVHSHTDPLTGIHNRRYFVKQIESDISHYLRTACSVGSNSNIVFMLIDIDYFKSINDRHGHNTGDDVLKQVVGCLKKNIREGDYLIRWGGEEFLIALRPDHVTNVEQMCDRLLLSVKETSFQAINDEELKLTVSLGMCFYPIHKDVIKHWGWESFLDMADKALFKAKRDGRNRWVGYRLHSKSIKPLSDIEDTALEEADFKMLSSLVNR